MDPNNNGRFYRGKLGIFILNLKDYLESKSFRKTRKKILLIAFCAFLFGIGIFIGLKTRPSGEIDTLISDDQNTAFDNEGTESVTSSYEDEQVLVTQHDLNDDSEPEGSEVLIESEPEFVEVFVPNRIIMPASGQIIKRPGWYYSEELSDWRYYTGIDIATRPGTQIQAAEVGIIKKIYRDDDFGTVIAVIHGDRYETRYGGVSCPGLVLGQQIGKGETIGWATEDVLHFEMFQNDEAVDFIEFLGDGN